MGLKYHDEMKDEPSYNLFIQGSIRTENQLMVFSDYSSKDVSEKDSSTGSYVSSLIIAVNSFQTMTKSQELRTQKQTTWPTLTPQLWKYPTPLIKI